MAVAVAGREHPEVVLRSQLELVDPALPAQAYHAAGRQRQLAGELGAGLGPPWRADHKQAALLALVALADQVPGMLLGVAPGDHSLTETP